MKQTIISPLSPARLHRKLLLRSSLCIVLALLTAGLNVFLLFTYTEVNYSLHLWLNILSDIFCGIFIIAYSSFRIFPVRQLLQLARRKTVPVSGTVQQISDATTRYLNLDCQEITLDSRCLYLPIRTIQLKTGEFYRFRTASNIIVEAQE